MSWFKNRKEDLEFIDDSGLVYPHYPPVLAKTLKPLKKHQEEKTGEYNFPGCPGMHDYSRLGYILPAWTNIHIKANKAGCVAQVGSVGEDTSKRGTPLKQPAPMSPNITDGMFDLQDGIEMSIWNCSAPWKIFGHSNVSTLILPAWFHSNFLDDLHVYPGVVDYRGFNTINFIFSPKRKCELTIHAGDPLLHVIPLITDKTILASYGNGTQKQRDAVKLVKWFHETNFYRKYYMIRKKFEIFYKE